ncbi:NADPH-dependent FMN reductase [Rodentibacter sp. Ppn85]|uniref:NADPH-dependent FMN reductase n=1 Tax=Rodentibacter sp. Ppn85 TaxID=1908525 RepID=UPI001E44E29C|nr:NAD(P)H-dependent oxidoreductase [Rodentibacter sp. Ppn85]
MTKVAFIVGSLSQRSINRHIANEILKNAPQGVEIEEIRIGDLPLYTQDLDSQSIPAYDRVRLQIKDAAAVLIVSPEHNRSVPAALKNVIDIASRPFGQNVWANKKVAIVTA